MARNRRGSEHARSAEFERLRTRLRKLEAERRALTKERDPYREALMARWKKESQSEDWSDFDPADYKYSLADIFAEFEKEEGVCLPRTITSTIPTRSRKSRPG